jgi:hypothetical protein
MYIGLTLIWAVLNTFALEVIAILDVISMWWQVNKQQSRSLLPTSTQQTSKRPFDGVWLCR